MRGFTDGGGGCGGGEGGDLPAEDFGGKVFYGVLDGFGVEGGGVEGLNGSGEGFDGLLGEKNAVLPWPVFVDEVAAASGGIGDNWTAGGEGFDGSDAERFEAGEKIGFSVMEISGEGGGFEPRDEGDQGWIVGRLVLAFEVTGELDEVFVFGAVADDEKGAVCLQAGADGEVDALPSDLAASNNEGALGERLWAERGLSVGWLRV